MTSHFRYTVGCTCIRFAAAGRHVASYVSTEGFVPRPLSTSELEDFPSLDWFDVASRVTPALRSSLERILDSQNGDAISLEEAYALAHAEGDDLLGLLTAADWLRAELSGNLVTYVVNRNINFTHICFVRSKFCSFTRGPRASATYFLHPDQVQRP